MKPPGAGPRILWCFEPSTRRQDVISLVAVDITGTNPVPITAVADDVFHPGFVLDLIPRLPGPVLLREDFVRLAIVVEVREDREFNVEARVDYGFVPIALPSRRIPPPGNLLRK